MEHLPILNTALLTPSTVALLEIAGWSPTRCCSGMTSFDEFVADWRVGDRPVGTLAFAVMSNFGGLLIGDVGMDLLRCSLKIEFFQARAVRYPAQDFDALGGVLGCPLVPLAVSHFGQEFLFIDLNDRIIQWGDSGVVRQWPSLEIFFDTKLGNPFRHPNDGSVVLIRRWEAPES